MRKTKTTIRLAAAMLALLSQIPAAQAEDTPGGADRAEFVSLTPKQLIEVEPSAYIENTEALGGAQLFYARPRLQNENGTYTMRPASLVGASMTLVYPYNATISKELKEKKHVYCWGRLDNLDMSDTGYAVDATATRYWARPSTSFFATFWPTKAGEKIVIDFSKYKEQLAEKVKKGDETAYEKCRNQGDSLRKRLLTLHAGAPPKDFTSCPWEDMLERRMKSSKACDGVSLDQPVVDELCKRFSWLSDTEAAESWQQVSDQKSWPKVWAKAAALDRKAIKYKKDFKEQISKRLSNPWLWTTKGIRTLNNTDSSFDGYLALKDSPYHEWDFGPKKLATDSKQKDSQPEGQPRQETLTQATEPAQQDSQLGGYHFLPVSGAVTALDKNGKPDESLAAKGGAVIISPAKTPPPAAYVLAIAADWKWNGSDDDALSLNENFQLTLNNDNQWEGGHTKPVRVPEFTRVECSMCAQNGQSPRPKGLNVTLNENKPIEFRWEGPAVKIAGNIPQSPIAYPAYLNRFKWKVVVALPVDCESDKGWKLSVKAAESPSLPQFGKYSDGSTPRAAWLPSAPYNLSTDMDGENIQMKEIAMMDGSSRLDSVSLEIYDENGNLNNKPKEKYKLYEITITSSNLREDFHYIQSGEMHNVWVFSSGTMTCAPDVTCLNKVYTIFGPSTWLPSGEIAMNTPKQGLKQVLPWENLLNVLTREWLCDENKQRILYTRRTRRDIEALKDAVVAMAHGVKNVYNYGIANTLTVFVDRDAFEYWKDEIPQLRTAAVIKNFPETWKIKETEVVFKNEEIRKRRENHMGFIGDRGANNNKPLMIPYSIMRDFTINCQKSSYFMYSTKEDRDKYDNSHYADITGQFTLLDLEAFCSTSPNSMVINCADCASVLTILPRICGFYMVIESHSGRMRFSKDPKKPFTKHNYNSFREWAVDATCMETTCSDTRWTARKPYVAKKEKYSNDVLLNGYANKHTNFIKKFIYLYYFSNLTITKN